MPANRKKTKTRVVQNRRYFIIKIARGLFSEYSYPGVSMSSIAKRLNITKAALYYHFSGKAEIYKKVLDEVFNGLSISTTEAFLEKTANKRLCKFIKNYLDFGLKEKNFMKALLLKLSPTDPQIKRHIIKLRKRVTQSAQPLVEAVIANKKISHKIDSRLATSMLTGMMDGLLLEYSLLGKKIDSEKMSNQIVAMLFQKVEV
jgi:AcrR family transcriptional regulator